MAKKIAILLLLLAFSLCISACAPNAPKVKRSGYKQVNPAHLYPDTDSKPKTN